MEPTKPDDSKPYTDFAAQIVGIDFNPSGNADVQRAKEYAAGLIDIIQHLPLKDVEDDVTRLVREGAITATLQAQMMVVKAITLK